MNNSRFAMKRSCLRIIFLVIFVGGAFPMITPTNAGLISSVHDRVTQIRFEEEPRMAAGLTKSSARRKGLAVGIWGGDHISMQVTDQRTTIEYDCANGTIEHGITLDHSGRFDVSGTQVAERGGPVRQNDQPAGEAVRYRGQVSGKRMKLSVRDSATKNLIGNFTLVYGAEGKLRKCR